MAQFFNKRYEFYGRQLVLEPYTTTGCVETQPDPAKMRDDAVAVDEQVVAFASLAYANCQGADHHYYDALADAGILSIVDGNLTTGTEKNYARRAPYQWNVMAGLDVITATTAEFVCASLAGRPPKQAGGREAQASVRRFGIVTTRATDGTAPDIAPLLAGLRACGVTPVVQQDDTTTAPAREGVNTMVKMQDAGVTSVLCLCRSNDVNGVYMPAASAQGYQPEWVESSFINNDIDNAYGGGKAPPEQSAHVIGISFRNKLNPPPGHALVLGGQGGRSGVRTAGRGLLLLALPVHAAVAARRRHPARRPEADPRDVRAGAAPRPVPEPGRRCAAVLPVAGGLRWTAARDVGRREHVLVRPAAPRHDRPLRAGRRLLRRPRAPVRARCVAEGRAGLPTRSVPVSAAVGGCPARYERARPPAAERAKAML
jgi:hypothetical protein